MSVAIIGRSMAVLGLSAAILAEARGQISFRKVADTSTSIPGGTGTFSGFGTDFNQPSISDSNVAFIGTGPGGQVGVYADFGSGPQMVADTTTAIPAGGGNFTDFDFPAISGTNVSYTASGPSGFRGIYLDTGSGPQTVADTTTVVPGDTDPFTGFFGTQDLSGTAVVLPGIKQTAPAESVIYADFGSGLVAIADRDTAIPGGTGNFSVVADPSISGTNIAFNGFGTSTQRGIYADLGSGLVRIADRSTAIPDGVGTFDFLSLPRLSGSNLIFRGNDAGSTQTGIYGDFGSGLFTIADQNTPIPGGVGTFELLGLAAISGSNVVFTAGFGGGTEIGLYALYNGSYLKILDSTETFDGKELAGNQLGINLGINGFDGAEIVFEAIFADGTRGIYVATEPTSMALVALGLGAVVVRRATRSRG